jgi:hypothetical protein
MQVLANRTANIGVGLEALLGQALGPEGAAAALGRRDLSGRPVPGAGPVAPGFPAPPVDLAAAPGAQWLSVAPAAWWQWSWFDRQWQPAGPPDGAPPPSANGWMHWVQRVDGQWGWVASGADGSAWPTPTPPA